MAGDGKQEGSSEQLLSWVILFIIFLVCMYFVYVKFKPEVLEALRWVRYGELWLVTLFTPDSYSVKMPNGIDLNVKEFRDYIKDIPHAQLSESQMGSITRIALYPFKWVVVAIVGLIGLWAYTRGPGTQYTQTHNLDSFINFQSKSFPVIAPFVDFNPSKQPPRPPGADVPAELPAFAEALGPEEWLAYYEVTFKDNVLDKNSAFKAFARQLGPRWKGVKGLAPYKQILLAACCLKASRKREASDEMLGRLAKCWTHKGGLKLGKETGLLRDARKVLKNKDLSNKVLKNCKQHAWQTTALLRALLTARDEGGVMAPAQFVWLRAYDRELWYPLNNLGRQSNHAEALGAMAHFKAEKRAQRPIPKPKVQEAVQTIEEYMVSSNARPIPSLDYSQSKNKRGIKKLKEA